ncbi:hypothetical protein F4678DRAFT_464559 [Xylaria arbuscula]|nr:hypothetical protein F4678DRAFT_464559 [Xylaria arbuscula]
MKADKHNISSHNSHIHTQSSYQQQMLPRNHICYFDGCNHRSRTYPAILSHLRRRHGVRGSSNAIKARYGIPLGNRRNNEETGEEVNGENAAGINPGSPEEALHEVESETNDNQAGPSNQAGPNDQAGPNNQAGPSNHEVPSLENSGLIDPALLLPFYLYNTNSDNGGSGQSGSGADGETPNFDIFTHGG